MNDQYLRSLQCAQRYRALGLCPLPSRMDVKGPALATYAQHWTTPVPEAQFTEAAWTTTNIQLMTGALTPGAVKILVIDCDGPKALATWGRLTARHQYQEGRTWRVRTGGGGWHTYFRLPWGLATCPSGLLWGLWDTDAPDGRGSWAKHKEIRLLGDHALVIAPPSRHVQTRTPYEFLGDQGPNRLALPEPAPDWLLALPRLAHPHWDVPAPPKRLGSVPTPALGGPPRAWYDRDVVLAAIGDKVALAASWGLQIARWVPNGNGWVSCFVPQREDSRYSSPSGSFHAEDGVFQDRRDLSTMSLFDLGVLLQPAQFADWRACRDWCGARYLGNRLLNLSRHR